MSLGGTLLLFNKIIVMIYNSFIFISNSLKNV